MVVAIQGRIVFIVFSRGVAPAVAHIGTFGFGASIPPPTSASSFVGKAAQVEVATYMFDDTELYKLFVRRLADKSHFSLDICLDQEMFLNVETPKLQRPRIQRLIESGARV